MDAAYYESIGVHPLLNQFTQSSVPEIGLIGERLPVVYEGQVTSGSDFGISGKPGTSTKQITHINHFGQILGAAALVLAGFVVIRML